MRGAHGILGREWPLLLTALLDLDISQLFPMTQGCVVTLTKVHISKVTVQTYPNSMSGPGLLNYPVIIERTIGLVLGPSTVLYEPFLKHCTLTNEAVGTIWRALSKTPQRRQGPDLCPLWLLVGTPLAIRPELAFSRAEHSRPYLDVAKYIFDI